MGTGLSVDASTLALFRADEATANLIDATGTYVLTKFGSIVGAPGLVSGAVIIDSPTKYFTHAGDAALRGFQADATWTIEALIKTTTNSTTIAPLGHVNFTTIEVPASNAWGTFLRAYEQILYFGGGPNSGAGGFTQIDHLTSTGGEARNYFQTNAWVYLAIVNTGVSAHFYINGQWVAKKNTPTGGATLTGGALMIGNNWDTPNHVNTANDKHGLINEIRFSTISRTQEELKQNWINYNAPVIPPLVRPIISNVSPANGSTIISTTPVSFDVTDDSGLFTRIIVTDGFELTDLSLPASYENILEVIHNGEGFGPLYQGVTNVRTSILNGYHYVILRDGGWIPGVSPVLTPYAIDQTGSENL